MIAANFTNVRDNLKAYCDKATYDYETVIITRKNNDNVVLISEEAYNNLMENLFIMSDKENYQRLLLGKQQIENGQYQLHDTIEVDE